eukprot:799651-Amorphochlora_amoeboformis.AAC.1
MCIRDSNIHTHTHTNLHRHTITYIFTLTLKIRGNRMALFSLRGVLMAPRKSVKWTTRTQPQTTNSPPDAKQHNQTVHLSHSVTSLTPLSQRFLPRPKLTIAFLTLSTTEQHFSHITFLINPVHVVCNRQRANNRMRREIVIPKAWGGP